MRVPVTGYYLDIGKAHTDFAEAKLQQRLVERKLSDEEVNQLAVVAMAGATAEAMNYDQACSHNPTGPTVLQTSDQLGIAVSDGSCDDCQRAQSLPCLHVSVNSAYL